MFKSRNKKFMDSSTDGIKLHFDILPRETKGALDFFTKLSRFDNVDLLDRISSGGNLEIELNKDNTIFAKLLGAKISFIAYPFFVPQQIPMNYGAVKILLPIDIAVMKVVAISQRGRKRDFFDLYWCAKNLEPLEE